MLIDNGTERSEIALIKQLSDSINTTAIQFKFLGNFMQADLLVKK